MDDLNHSVRRRLVSAFLANAAVLDEPGQKLAFAVINQAIKDLLDPEESRDAAQYLLNKEYEPYAEACDLDPDLVLEAICTARLYMPVKPEVLKMKKVEKQLHPLYNGLFSHRDSISEALEYSQGLAKACEDPMLVLTAVQVVINTIVKETVGLPKDG